jgi:GxxExxY protein
MDTMTKPLGVLMYRQRQPLLDPAQEEVITSVVACGLSVHRELGPGFKEAIYERAFCLELDSRGIKFECQKPVEVRYKQWTIPGQRIDLIVDGVVLVEIKTVNKLKKLHESQVVSYLRTTELRVGLLMNFNSVLFKHGLRRVVL